MNDAFAPVSSLRIFWAILMRDVTVARREIVSFLVRTALQPILFTIVFGFLLPKMQIIPHGYTTMMLPGIVALSLTLSAVQSVALPMVAEFGYTKEIEDRLLAPIPTPLVAIEKVVAGTIQGLIAAAFVLPMSRLIIGPVPGMTFRNAPMLLLITILGGAAFSALGLFFGTAIAPQQIGLMFSVFIAPMIMFGCAYYPWRGLDAIPAMKYAVLINPLVYASEGMRATLTPSVPHMHLGAIVAALVILTAIFTWLGLRAFMKRAIS
ncbi:MAG TPA: ABC transporter permease [Thermoanaerobaculia bacterium]|nr:ABC transporter permease [Thermoanaerobaculia bacterium]